MGIPRAWREAGVDPTVVSKSKAKWVRTANRHPILDTCTAEEKKFSPICPDRKCYVTLFTCTQCTCFELHDDARRQKENQLGACVYPRRHSKRSHKVLFARTSSTHTPPKKERESGGMHDKTDYAVSLIKKGSSRQDVIKALLKKFPEMKAGYAAAVHYQATKALKEKSSVDSYRTLSSSV